MGHPFPLVTDDEVFKMVEALSKEDFDVDEVHKLSKTWIKAVMNQPYKKNKLVRRPFEYSKKKLMDYLTWRKKSHITSKIAYNLAYKKNDHNDGSCNTKSSSNQDLINHHKDKKKQQLHIATTASPGALYWYGTDNEGSPILWYLANLTRFEKVNVKNEMECTSLVIQAALDIMPSGIHDFTFIILFDVFNPLKAMMKPNLAPAFIKTFLTICPDRLKQAVMVTGTIGHVFYELAKRLAPGNVMDKVVETKSRERAGELLVTNGIVKKEEIPDFMGGTFSHDKQITTEFPANISAIKDAMEDSTKD